MYTTDVTCTCMYMYMKYMCSTCAVHEVHVLYITPSCCQQRSNTILRPRKREHCHLFRLVAISPKTSCLPALPFIPWAQVRDLITSINFILYMYILV